MQVLRPSLSLSPLALALLAASAAATQVTILNQCSETVQLYDNSAVQALAPGASTSRTLADGYLGMFRNGMSPQATRAFNAFGLNWEVFKVSSDAMLAMSSGRVLHHGRQDLVRHQHHPHGTALGRKLQRASPLAVRVGSRQILT